MNFLKPISLLGCPRTVVCWLIGTFFSLQVTVAQTPPATGADATQLVSLLAVGQRIYREGIGSSGESIRGAAPGGVVLSGSEGACTVCHRRSGYGGSEGKFNIRPIIGPALFEEQSVVLHSPRVKAQLGVRLRPSYDAVLLARAIRSGVDSAGQPLDAVMPRFNLSDYDIKAVSAYLATLSAVPSPGVDANEIHFATVIQPGVSPEKRRAMLSILEAFFNDKNANVRSDVQRREAGNMRMYRAYRKWVLHVWDLTGPSDSWSSQLEVLYRRQAVFALIGGLGVTSWQPIHAFSERFEIPSVFPQVDMPGLADDNHYNFYLTRGLTLEAQVLARFLAEKAEIGRVIQVYRRDATGLLASTAFRQGLSPDMPLQDMVLDGQAGEAFWRAVYAQKPSAVVSWLGGDDLSAASLPAEADVPMYLSFQLLGGTVGRDVARKLPNPRFVYSSDLAPKHDARLLRTKAWLHNKGIALVDESTQINTQFAVTVVSDAVGHIMDSFSRDYFVERIEHVVGQTPAPSIYPSVSLGPGQRFAAKGGSIVQLGEAGQLKALSGWIVP